MTKLRLDYYMAARAGEGCGHRHGSVRTAMPCLRRFARWFQDRQERRPPTLGIYFMSGLKRGVLVEKGKK